MMKRLFIIMALLTNAWFAFSQIATYKSNNGHVVNMAVTSSYTMFQLDGNNPFTLVMSGVSNGWYMYSFASGTIGVSLDLQNLVIVTANPPTQLLFKLVTFSSGSTSPSMPSVPGQYQSHRSRSQIQYDINKTEARIEDNERILKGLQDRNESYTLWPTYQRLIREDRDRLYQLQQELINADY